MWSSIWWCLSGCVVCGYYCKVVSAAFQGGWWGGCEHRVIPSSNMEVHSGNQRHQTRWLQLSWGTYILLELSLIECTVLLDNKFFVPYKIGNTFIFRCFKKALMKINSKKLSKFLQSAFCFTWVADPNAIFKISRVHNIRRESSVLL